MSPVYEHHLGVETPREPHLSPELLVLLDRTQVGDVEVGQAVEAADYPEVQLTEFNLRPNRLQQ